MKKMLEQVANGIKIDVLKVQPPMTPIVILGYSDEERLERFNNVFQEYNKKFEEAKEKARKLIEGSKNPKLRKE